MSPTLPTLSTSPVPTTSAAGLPFDRLARITVKQYHGMIEIGVFGEDEHLELLDGWMLRKFDDSSPFRGPNITLPARNRTLSAVNGWEHIVPADRLRRITVDEYHRMTEAGVLTENDRVELLDGLLVNKMARNPPHDGTLSLLLRALFKSIPDGWEIRCQAAIVLESSEPEPDITIVRADPGNYRTRHPNSSDAAIVIEVSDSTLGMDLNYKSRLYAENGIPEYWVVNIPDRQLEVFTQPSPTGYGTRQVFPAGTLVPVILDGQTVASLDMAELFR